MKRNILSLIVILTVILSGCINQEELPMPDNERPDITIEDANSLIIKGGPSFAITGVITLKYNSDLTDNHKIKLRNANYAFTVDSVQWTLCNNVEQWHVTFPVPPSQNGYTQGNLDMERDNSSFDLLDYTQRVELNWVGWCTDF